MQYQLPTYRKGKGHRWNQGCEAGAQAILDGWSQKRFDGGAGVWNSGSSFTEIDCGTSELYKWYNAFFYFLDQIVSDPEPKTYRCRSWNQKIEMPGAGPWNLSTGSTALVGTTKQNKLSSVQWRNKQKQQCSWLQQHFSTQPVGPKFVQEVAKDFEMLQFGPFLWPEKRDNMTVFFRKCDFIWRNKKWLS